MSLPWFPIHFKINYKLLTTPGFRKHTAFHLHAISLTHSLAHDNLNLLDLWILIPVSSFQVGPILLSLPQSFYTFSNSITFLVFLSLFLTTHPSSLLNSRFTSQVYPDPLYNLTSLQMCVFSGSTILVLVFDQYHLPFSQLFQPSKLFSNFLLLLTEPCKDEQSHQAQLKHRFISAYPSSLSPSNLNPILS